MYISLSKNKSDNGASKKKRVSKKKKSAWRKHSDIKDVENYLDDLRFQERVGLKFDTAEDNALFFEDKKPERPQRQYVKRKSAAARKIEAEKRLKSGPTSYRILEERSSVPAPVIIRNEKQKAEERKKIPRKRIREKTTDHAVSTAKGKSRVKKNTIQHNTFLKDLWADESKPDLDWLDENTIRHTMNNTRRIMKNVPTSVTRKTSVLPAIEPPHPGTSYNPSYKEHSELLESIVEKENVLIKEERHLFRVTDQMFRKVTPKQLEMNYLKEMSQGLNKELKREEENVGSEYVTVNPPTLDKKKTRKTRRNLKLAKQEELMRKMKAIEKKKIADIYKLKKITEHLNKEEVEVLEKQKITKKKREKKALEPKRLSKVKFQEHETEFQMPTALRGNLREMKPEGSIFYDRFKSLEKRNILAPTKFQRIRKKGKKKVFVKASHKIDSELQSINKLSHDTVVSKKRKR